MDSALQVFSNEKFSVRALNENGEFWFVAKDVATALEYPENSVRQANNLFGSVPGMWKGHKRIMTLGGEQEMLCVTEQGLYFFLGRSDKPKALPYQMWIAGDVVPSIRKTGSYSARQNTAAPVDPIAGAKIVFEAAGIRDNQLALALDRVYMTYTGASALKAVMLTSEYEEPDENNYATYHTNQSNDKKTVAVYETKMLKREKSNIATPMTQETAEHEHFGVETETLPSAEPSQAESIDAGTWPESEPETEQGTNIETTQNEPLPLMAVKGKGGRPKGEKRVQVSVYLRSERI